jgi:hypothetical protein
MRRMHRLSPQDLSDLARAKQLLEHRGVAIELANLLGTPVERLIERRLPKRATALVHKATDAAIGAAFRTAVSTLQKDRPGVPARRWLHRTLTIGAGAAGGFFGWAGLAIELPITTTLILRSIADIAREEGESPHAVETRLACLEVLAFGGPTHADDGAESGYFATRAVLAQQVAAVSRHIAKHGVAEGGAPVVMRFVQAIAARFSVPVSQKALAEMVPILGAAAGAGLNAIFIAHFQNLAHGHFIIRRLERTRGVAVVRKAFDALEPGG